MMKDALGHGSNARGVASDKYARGRNAGRRGKPLIGFNQQAGGRRAEIVAGNRRTDFMNTGGGRKFGTLDFSRVGMGALAIGVKDVVQHIPAHETGIHEAVGKPGEKRL
jgi:hypothetical protein